jgi:hypothetical protein
MAQRRRVRRDWAAVVKAQADSGLTAVEFCRQQGIPRKSFYRGRQRLQAAPPAGFVELRPLSTPGSGVALVLDGGWRIEVQPGFDVATFERLWAGVRRSGVCSP